MVARVPRLFLLLAAVAGGVLLLQHAWPRIWALSWPFAAGGLYSASVEPLVARLQRYGLPRGVSAIILLVGGFMLGGAWMAWAVYTAWREAAELGHHLVSHYQGQAPLHPWQRELERIAGSASPFLLHIAGSLQHVAGALPGAVFALFVAFATAFFAVRDRGLLVGWLRGHLRSERLLGVEDVFWQAHHATWGIIRAQTLLALTTFGISFLGLVLIGAPYAVLAALGAALLDFLPLVGPGVIFLPWMVVEVISGHLSAGLGLGVVFSAVGLVRWVLTPRLLGAGVGLHPFVAMASMYVGSRLVGVAGLFLGPLVTTVVVRWMDLPTGTGDAGRGCGNMGREDAQRG